MTKTQIMERYLDQEAARQVLAEMGIKLTERQMRRATEPDHKGRRKLPFFKDPIRGRLIISYADLVKAFQVRQTEANRNCTGL